MFMYIGLVACHLLSSDSNDFASYSLSVIHGLDFQSDRIWNTVLDKNVTFSSK